MLFKRIAAVVIWLLVTLTSAFGFMASELRIAPGDFFCETIDCTEENNSSTRDLCRENGWLNYDTLSGCSVATNNATNLVSPSRAKHILVGDATGGGHKFGISRLFNGKSKFPATWSNDKILNAISEVATNPNSKWIQQTGKPGSLFTKAGDPVKFKVEGVFNGTNIRAIVQGDEIITAFPIK